MNPYILPLGNVQIAFSGGRSSAKMLHHIIEANGGIPARAVATFENTGREMNEGLDFVAECGSRWGVGIHWIERAPTRALTEDEYVLVAQVFGDQYAARLADWWEPTEKGYRIVNHNSAARHGEPFIALILHRGMLPNVLSRFCTVEMKVRAAKKFLMDHLGWEHWTNACGMRADEPSRLKREQPKERWTAWYPLADAGVSKRDVAAFWRAQPFDLRLPNVNGSCWLGNCDGCFLKSEANLSALARDYPDRHDWWEKAETLASLLTTGTAAAWSKRYKRHELRDLMERVPDMLDKGLLCQADDGECFG